MSAASGRVPIKRRRITAPGTKPISGQKPSYDSFYLYGAIEPETGQRFFLEQERLTPTATSFSWTGFRGRFLIA
jgi:hypothetical protein